MNFFMILLILIANIVAGLLIYHSFGKQMDKNKKLITSMIIIGAMYIISTIIYFLSGLGIEKFSKSQDLRNYLMMAFVPVNLIIIMPYAIYSFMKTKKGELSKKILNKRLLVIEIIAVILFIIEFFYFRSAQKNMKNLADEAQNLLNNQEIVENIEKQDEALNSENLNMINIENSVNEISTNEISNSEKTNENLVKNEL